MNYLKIIFTISFILDLGHRVWANLYRLVQTQYFSLNFEKSKAGMKILEVLICSA